MALISNPVTHGTLSEKELAEAFSAERRSVDILSTDFDSSTEGSIGGESSLWESSDRDEVTGDESADDSMQFSGSISDNGFAYASEAISIESTGSGTEGDNEEPVPRYALRPRKKKHCKPPAKRTRNGDTTSDEDEALSGGGSLPSQHSSGYVGHGQGGGSRGRGRGGGSRGRGRGRGRGGGSTKKSSKKQSDSVPTCATPIGVTDSRHKDSDVPRGTGYYIRDSETDIVYCVWKDTHVVSVMSTCHPGHQSPNLVSRNCLGADGKRTTMEIPRPIAIEKYNQFMGGVDKSDQYLAYHNVLWKTVRYWKTLFYHMIDVAVVNAFVLYNHLALLSGCRTVSENDFRDELVLQIIDKYGKHSTPDTQPGRPSCSGCRVQHGSIFSTSKRRCQYCKLVGKPTRLTQRKCPDCIGEPTLCQTRKCDCHSMWHSPSFDGVRSLWFAHYESKQQQQSTASGADTTENIGVVRGPGCPRGSINKQKRRGNYRSRSF